MRRGAYGVILMKTFSPTPKDIKHDWYVVDAQDQVLGRLASQIAHRLRGKHKPEFAPHVDNGDFIGHDQRATRHQKRSYTIFILRPSTK